MLIFAFSNMLDSARWERIEVGIVWRSEKSQQYLQAAVWLGKFIEDCNQMASDCVVAVDAHNGKWER